MAKDHLQRLQKQRVRKDKHIELAITMGGWLVLVTLLVLIWHLFSVTRPILNNPDVVRHQEIPILPEHQLIAVHEVEERMFYLFSDEQCAVFLAQPSPDGLDGQSKSWSHKVSKILPAKTQQQEGDCSDIQQLTSWGQQLFLFRLSEQGILRGYRFVPDRKRFSDKFFSTRVFDSVIQQREHTWQVTLNDETLSLLLQNRYGTGRFVRYSRATHSVLIEHQLTDFYPNKKFRLSDSEKLDLLYSEDVMLLLPDEADESGAFSVQREGQNKIVALSSLATQRSVMLVDDSMQLEKWALLNRDGRNVLHKIYSLELAGSQLKHFAHVDHDLVMVLVDRSLHFVNATSGEVLQSSIVPVEFEQAYVFQKKLFLHHGNTVSSWQIANASSMVSFRTLWEKIWYDGYQGPDYVWQTSSASDDWQSKYSVMPLLMGSIKAAFLALVVAIPLGLGSAIYSGYYAGSRVRKVIKPYVEALEAIPSVVIGFIAAMWLLPVSENYLLALLLFFMLTPVFFVIFVFLNESRRHLNIPGWELLFFIIILMVYLAAFQLLLAGDYSFMFGLWSSADDGHLSSEVRHTYVLALALGIAVVPTVFTIAEDAIYQVPRSVTMASFAMGATRAQTLVRVVLKFALPGIVSAVMLGFARAVGETMIVLMISGNTPVANWDLLEGLRTMTASLAIELPEARPGSVHYQVLFLVAIILFGFTFVFNTIAELFRLKLRTRYRL